MTPFRQAVAEYPWIWRGVQLTAAGALGTALPDILALAHRVLS